jgi:hypothetical protein
MRNCLNCPDITIRKCASGGALKARVELDHPFTIEYLEMLCSVYRWIERKK